MTDKRRPFSSVIINGLRQTRFGAMPHAASFDNNDFKKSQIRIASASTMVASCNMLSTHLADHNEKGESASVSQNTRLVPSASLGAVTDRG